MTLTQIVNVVGRDISPVEATYALNYLADCNMVIKQRLSPTMWNQFRYRYMLQ